MVPSFEGDVSVASLLSSEDVDQDFLLEKNHDLDERRENSRYLQRASNISRFWTAVATLALLCGSNLFTYWATVSSRPPCPVTESVGEPPKLTPMLRDLKLKTEHVRFDSTLFDQGSRYRKPPSPEVDAAWEQAGANFGFIMIPEEEADESDLSPEHMHLIGTEDQAGLKGIPVNVEVFHQLHCLNMMRKTTWYNYDYYRKLGEGPFQHPDRDLAIHVDHCIDNLRQRIMCTSDVGLVPFYWVGDDGGTDPVFSRVHTCRDFESLHDWMAEHQQRLGSNDTLLPQPGDFRVDHFH